MDQTTCHNVEEVIEAEIPSTTATDANVVEASVAFLADETLAQSESDDEWMMLNDEAGKEALKHADDVVKATTTDEPSSSANAGKIPNMRCADIPLYIDGKFIKVYAASIAMSLCI